VSKVHLEVTMMKRIAELNVERIHNLNQIGGLQEENALLKAEVERLTAFTTLTIIPNQILQAEIERLKNNNEYLDKKLDEYIDAEETPKA
jgi:uncharacterized small protein (DUF1192 family)